MAIPLECAVPRDTGTSDYVYANYHDQMGTSIDNKHPNLINGHITMMVPVLGMRWRARPGAPGCVWRAPQLQSAPQRAWRAAESPNGMPVNTDITTPYSQPQGKHEPPGSATARGHEGDEEAKTRTGEVGSAPRAHAHQWQPARVSRLRRRRSRRARSVLCALKHGAGPAGLLPWW